ncbi:MAG: tRNA (adenosine(37)-N6)-threonylcarbamoyltransferase complex ATPase subunit type 1 TsaE [Bacteroidales bacterium]|nr:tRNA (adenosine(37)-N6)-threonylcarbamoyltransferase complex ATPase subunit type 1 TsaE [Bacteroidales bacterium]
MSARYIAKSPRDLPEIAQALLTKYPDPGVFAFYGKMGAGKTTFIREICNALKVTDNVSSPTFAIINEYHTRVESNVYHFDFYRINKLAEAIDLGTEEYFYSDNYCLVEWPELIEDILPDQAIKVTIEVDPENDSRIFSF